MLYIQTIKEKQVIVTPKTQTYQGSRRGSQSPGGVLQKPTGHVSRSRRSKRASVWWDELGYQPRPGGPIPQPGKWVQHPKARKTGPMPLCLSLDTPQEWLGCKRAVVKSWPWRGGGTPKGTEAPVTSYVTPAMKPTRGTQGKQGHAQY